MLELVMHGLEEILRKQKHVSDDDYLWSHISDHSRALHDLWCVWIKITFFPVPQYLYIINIDNAWLYVSYT